MPATKERQLTWPTIGEIGAVVGKLDLRGRRHEGEIAAPRIHLMEADTDLAGPHRELHRDQNRAVRQACGHQPEIKVARSDLFSATVNTVTQPGVESDCNQRQLRRRIGVGKRTSNSPSRASGGMSDEGNRTCE
jgi:hypothetical protein